MPLAEDVRRKLLEFQRNEITEYYVYKSLARKVGDRNSKVLEAIASEEMKHYRIFREHTGEDVRPRWVKVWFYTIMGMIFGLTFALKLMEGGEENAQKVYRFLKPHIPEADEIMRDEFHHEHELLAMIDERKLEYVGSMVLGLNDALVELTGALAGLSFALQNTPLIGVVGLITGIAAAMSMAASEYLSQKSEKSDNPGLAATYTGMAYIITVVLLILPYFIFHLYYIALAATVIMAVLIIGFFTFYISIVKNHKFSRLFGEMVTISMGIAAISFVIGIIVRAFFHVDI